MFVYISCYVLKIKLSQICLMTQFISINPTDQLQINLNIKTKNRVGLA